MNILNPVSKRLGRLDFASFSAIHLWNARSLADRLLSYLFW